MTTTEQDEELRNKISKMCEGIAAGYHGQDGIDYIMQLITADMERVALEARIDETEKFVVSPIDPEETFKYQIRRIAVLKAQQEGK